MTWLAIWGKPTTQEAVKEIVDLTNCYYLYKREEDNLNNLLFKCECSQDNWVDSTLPYASTT